MKKSYEYIGTIELNEIVAITTNIYSWLFNPGMGWSHNQQFKIFLKSGNNIEISWYFLGNINNPDTEELINFRKKYAEFVNDFLSLNIPANI